VARWFLQLGQAISIEALSNTLRQNTRFISSPRTMAIFYTPTISIKTKAPVLFEPPNCGRIPWFSLCFTNHSCFPCRAVGVSLQPIKKCSLNSRPSNSCLSTVFRRIVNVNPTQYSCYKILKWCRTLFSAGYFVRIRIF